MGAFQSTAKPVVKPQISNIDRAVLDLKNARDRLQRYRQHLEADEVKLLQKAALAKKEGKTQKALGLLRLRKYKQQQLSNVEDQLLNVLKMVETIDSKQNEGQVLDALAAGKDALKRMHEERTVEDVLDLMDAVREENEVEQEISEILQGVPSLSVEDEEAVERELEEMEKELNPEMPVAPKNKLPVQELPSVPAKKLPEQQQEERIAVPG